MSNFNVEYVNEVILRSGDQHLFISSSAITGKPIYSFGVCHRNKILDFHFGLSLSALSPFHTLVKKPPHSHSLQEPPSSPILEPAEVEVGVVSESESGSMPLGKLADCRTFFVQYFFYF